MLKSIPKSEKWILSEAVRCLKYFGDLKQREEGGSIWGKVDFVISVWQYLQCQKRDKYLEHIFNEREKLKCLFYILNANPPASDRRENTKVSNALLYAVVWLHLLNFILSLCPLMIFLDDELFFLFTMTGFKFKQIQAMCSPSLVFGADVILKLNRLQTVTVRWEGS